MTEALFYSEKLGDCSYIKFVLVLPNALYYNRGRIVEDV